ncbi:MAG: hypothetical protein M3Z22_04250, partial [Verrucomicrobiota bacterium]|nr:hypothetical protein [Verrucomicrobiota bacterium]
MKAPSRFVFTVAAVALFLPFTGCVAPSPTTPPPSSSAICAVHDLDGPPIPANFTGTLQRTHRTRAANHVVQLNSIDTGCCADFD